MRLLLSYLLLTTAVGTLVYGSNSLTYRQSHLIKGGAGHSLRERWNRSPIETMKALYQGFKATNELLKSAKQVADSQYQKAGTYAEAVDDFTSVGPTQVKSLILAHAVGRIGMIGDRAIVVKSSSEQGYPILKIFKPKLIPFGKNKDDPVSVEIVYKKY